ncbi:MAG TPA: formylglycine-generating enzyme family protein [Phototrophicaceae bacterium]|nr:formylglycine-generating enzyme family protein [Phototrophicaceae bacterium]
MPQKLRSVVEGKYRREHEFRIKLVAAIYEQVVAAAIPCFPPDLSYHYRHWEDAMPDDHPWEDPIGMTNRFIFQVDNFYATCGFVFRGLSTGGAYQARKDVIVLEFCENTSASRVDLLPEYIPKARRRYEINMDETTQASLIQWGFQRQIQFGKCRFWVKVYSVNPSTEQQSVISQVIEDIGKLQSLTVSVVAPPISSKGTKPELATHHNAPKTDLHQVGSLPKPTQPELSTGQDAPQIVSPPIHLFPNPEQARLLRELEDMNTSHQQRRTIGERLAAIGDPRPGVGLRPDGIPQIEWCYVAGGEVEIKEWRFQVEPFCISKYLITYSQFQAFLDAVDGFAAQEEQLQKLIEANNEKSAHEAQYKGTEIQQEMAEERRILRAWVIQAHAHGTQKLAEQPYKIANYPRVNINWHQARAFTSWLSAKLYDPGWPQLADEIARIRQLKQGEKQTPYLSVRLPTEWEWQLAATGGDPTRIYPWGTETDNRCLNSSEAEFGQPISVGMYPAGAASCSALDMAGNVLEWCINDGGRYFRRIDGISKQRKTARGGSWNYSVQWATCAYHSENAETYFFTDTGFRVVVGGYPVAPRTEKIKGK